MTGALEQENGALPVWSLMQDNYQEVYLREEKCSPSVPKCGEIASSFPAYKTILIPRLEALLANADRNVIGLHYNQQGLEVIIYAL